MAIQIEEAVRGDAPTVIDLQSQLFEEDAGVHDVHADIRWPAQHGEADFLQLLENPEAVVLLARGDGEVCGLTVGYVNNSGETRQPIRVGVLRTMYVRPQSRGQGIGALLTDAFMHWARTQGCAEAEVSSYFDNVAARRLYERCGFVARSVSHAQQLGQ